MSTRTDSRPVLPLAARPVASCGLRFLDYLRHGIAPRRPQSTRTYAKSTGCDRTFRAAQASRMVGGSRDPATHFDSFGLRGIDERWHAHRKRHERQLWKHCDRLEKLADTDHHEYRHSFDPDFQSYGLRCRVQRRRWNVLGFHRGWKESRVSNPIRPPGCWKCQRKSRCSERRVGFDAYRFTEWNGHGSAVHHNAAGQSDRHRRADRNI